MKYKNILFISFILIIQSSLAFSNTLLLKCTSLKFFEDDWIGNILFVKIDNEKKSVLTKEPADKLIDGWVNHKLTSVSSSAFIFKSCLSLNCKIDENGYFIIDRDIGTLKYFLRTNKEEKFTRFFSYQCKKIKKAF